MKKDAVTYAEIKAYKLMTQGQSKSTRDYMRFDRIRQEADNIIMLAEKIKAERASCAMFNSL